MRGWVALGAILMTAAACGSPDTSTRPSPSPVVTTPASIHVSHIHIGS